MKERGSDSKVQPVEKIIPARTIVINTNIIKKEYSWFDIYHECYDRNKAALMCGNPNERLIRIYDAAWNEYAALKACGEV